MGPAGAAGYGAGCPSAQEPMTANASKPSNPFLMTHPPGSGQAAPAVPFAHFAASTGQENFSALVPVHGNHRKIGYSLINPCNEIADESASNREDCGQRRGLAEN